MTLTVSGSRDAAAHGAGEAQARDPIGRAPRLAIPLLVAFAASVFLITPFVMIDRTVSTIYAQVVAVDPLVTYQALDVSIVKTIDVKEGQEVEPGQLLATLDPTIAVADVSQLSRQVAGLDAQIARVKAEQDGKPLVFDGPDTPDNASYRSMQRLLFDQRAQQFKSQVDSFDAKIAAAQATIAKMKADEAFYRDRSKVADQVFGMRDTLHQKGAASLLDLLKATDNQLEMKRAADNDANAIRESEHQLSSLMSDREAFIKQWFSTGSQELAQAQQQRDQAVASLIKAMRHRDLVRFTAPEAAIVLSVGKMSVGSILQQGDPLMKLVPLRSAVEFDVRLRPGDVGFVRPDEPVTLKVDAFNYLAHGSARGHVKWISEGTFTTDDDNKPVTDPTTGQATPFYKARIAVDHMDFVNVPQGFRLVPGMTGQADITVGTRSVYRYVVGFLTHWFGEAAQEP